MPMPEEVDEINEYLKARRQKQELGELPKPDLTPSFVKRMRGALFGEKVKPKVPLQSMQPTFVSPQAQSAVRKQLDEIMRERNPQASTPLPARTTPASPARPITIPNMPKYPDAAAWKAPAKPTAASLPPRPVLNVAPKPVVKTPVAKPASSGWGFWNKPKPAVPVAPPTRPITAAPTAIKPIPPKPVTSTAPPSAIPLSPPARTTASPQPYSDIPPLTTDGSSSANKSFTPIQSVRTPVSSTPAPVVPPAPVSPPPFAPVSAQNNSTPARTPYAPPWVTRNVPKPVISPALSAAAQSRNNGVPLPTAKTESVSPPTPAKVEQLAAPKQPVGKPWVTGTLPVEARDDFKSTVAAKPETKPVVPFNPSSSGEVHVDELSNSRKPEPVPKMDEALHEEISEEEALGKLPFEEVEGLSESDLAYLERKEQEHAQTHDEELDQVDPAALKAGLASQTQKLGAIPPQTSENDPKQEILRRLKKMMDEEHHSTQN